MRVFRKRIAERRLVIHKEAQGLRFQLFQVEACGKADLNRKLPRRIVRCVVQHTGNWVEPLVHTRVQTEPRRIVINVILRKVCNRGDNFYPRSFSRIAVEKIMLCKTSDQAVATEKKCKSFDYGCFAAIVGTNQDSVWSQLYGRQMGSSKALNLKCSNSHVSPAELSLGDASMLRCTNVVRSVRSTNYNTRIVSTGGTHDWLLLVQLQLMTHLGYKGINPTRDNSFI